LSVGGSGKSPMTEYLIRLLKGKYTIATLSRGYGRKTSGFRVVDANSSSIVSGDEPLQFKRKFGDITVAVCENRVKGIQKLESNHELIIMDDAFQHRAVKPGLSILLFDYSSLFQNQWLLPTGNLREPLWAIKRSDIVVVSKCPENMNREQRDAIINRFKTKKLFFSFLKYGNLKSYNEVNPDRSLKSINQFTKVILLTGIANADPLIKELNSYGPELIHHQYPDHHQFSEKNITKLVNAFKGLSGDDKLIITTEKDAQRLRSTSINDKIKDLALYYLPVEAEFMEPEKTIFNNLIEEYASKPAGNN
jgi:tetraacyldisaccharide 4'-kinase